MSVPERPPPPIIGKVTHHSVELYWDEALEKVNKTTKKGDGRVRICVQEEEKSGGWGNVYTGYGKKHIMDGLEPWTQYKYRMRLMNDAGNSEWSAHSVVSTTKEPKTGEHLHKAILLQNLQMMEEILDSGNIRDLMVDSPDKYGFSPLMQASQKGYIDFIEVLVKHGADVNYQNDAGKTAMMLAAYAGQTQSIKELRHYGAKYSIKDRGGSTALHWAMDGGNLELIDWILDDGADLHATDYNGWTPLLRVAAVGGNSDVAALLLRGGAEINKRDKDGKTPLMIAVVNGHQALVELLLQKDADLSVQNEYGKTAYEMAISMERRRVLNTLEEFMEKKGIKMHH